LLVETIKDLVRQSQETTSARPNTKRVTFKFLGVTINATALAQRIEDMERIKTALSTLADPLMFQIKEPIPLWTQYKNWVTPHDDSMLLVGLSIHGYGNWEKVRLDLRFNLKGKLAATGANSHILPTTTNISARVETIFKAIREFHQPAAPIRSKPRGRRKHHDDYESQDDDFETKVEKKSESKLSLRIPTRKKVDEYEEESSSAEEPEPEDIEERCSRLLSPLSVGMENLKKSLKTTNDEDEKLNFNKQFVVSIGDLVEKLISEDQSQGEEQQEFARCLWEIAATKYTRKTPEDMQRFYKSLRQKG